MPQALLDIILVEDLEGIWTIPSDIIRHDDPNPVPSQLVHHISD